MLPGNMLRWCKRGFRTIVRELCAFLSCSTVQCTIATQQIILSEEQIDLNYDDAELEMQDWKMTKQNAYITYAVV